MTEDPVFIMLVAVASLCAIIMIGLGFLPYPSRQAVIWSAAFAAAMTGCYVWLAGAALGLPALRGGAVAVIMGSSALVWVGLRARRQAARIYLVPTQLLYVAIIVAMAAAADQPWFGSVFRLALAVTAVFAAMTAHELLRMGPVHRDPVLPLLLVSVGIVLWAGFALIEGIVGAVRGEHSAPSLPTMHYTNALAAAVYLVAALVTLLLLTRAADADRAGPVAEAAGSSSDFATVARDRLARAERAGDRWWSLLEIRLDDPVAIREASSAAAYNRVIARFADDVISVLPAKADIDRVGDARYLALIPRPDSTLRTLLSELLARVATRVEDQGIDTRLSASIGWASVAAVGFDLAELTAAAADAADAAQRAGGDRWDRVAPARPDGARR